jgi:multidrug efflux system membrane fusion protein
MTRSGRTIAIVIVGLVIGTAVAIYWPPWQTPAQQQQQGKGFARKKGGGATQPSEAVPVLSIDARTADVPVYLDGVGTAKALNTVTVKPQVDGKLIAISFTEGQEVPKGFVLAKIDPTTYQAAYDQAVAKKGQDEAQLANQRLDLERYIKLSATNAIGKQQLDTQRALIAQYEALVKSDQALSTMRAPSCPTPTSPRRSPDGPVSARSTKAISCVPPTPPASSSSPRSSRSR